MYGAALKAAAADDFELDLNIPDWNTPTITEETCMKTQPPAVNKLSDIRDDKLALADPNISFTFKIAPNPFAKGSKYWVFYASDLVKFRRIVLKRFKCSSKRKNALESYMKVLEIRTIAMAYAREFNRDKLKPPKTCAIDFTPLDVIQCTRGAFYLLEPLLKGTVEKFDSGKEGATQSPYFDLLQTFSHYTWVKSRKTLLICNHQGFKERMKERLTLIDPTIHTVECEGKYGPLDMGKDAIEAFFEAHTCSPVCEQMKLEQYF